MKTIQNVSILKHISYHFLFFAFILCSVSCTSPAATSTIKSFTVSFDVDGGSAIEAITVKEGNAVTAPSNPTKDGFTFNGWYTEKTGGSTYDFKTLIKNNITLYARWVPVLEGAFTVSFDVDGGSTVNPVTVKSGETVTRPSNPTKGGFTFSGWHTAKTGGSSFDFNTAISKNVTLYAIWILKSAGSTTYTIKFVTTGSAVSDVTVVSGNTIGVPTSIKKDMVVAWYKEASFTNIFDFASPIINNMTLYAQHTPELFDTNDNPDGTVTLDKIKSGAVVGNTLIINAKDSKGKTVKGTKGYLSFIYGGKQGDYFIDQSSSGKIKELVIEEGIEVIGQNSFYLLTNLEKLTLPKSLKRIETSAFSGCYKLKEITIGPNVEFIGASTFNDCKVLSKITYATPSKLKEIGFGAFSNTNIGGAITFPPSVERLGENLFSLSKNVTSIDIQQNTNLKVIPAQICDQCPNLTSVTLNNAITEIGERAFQGTKLTSIDIPSTIEMIGRSAFNGCRTLATVNIPATNNLKYLGSYAFSSTAITSFDMNNGKTWDHNNTSYVFKNCTSLTTVTLPVSVERTQVPTTSGTLIYLYYTGKNYFEGCTALKTVNFPMNCNITNIYPETFLGCSALETITFSDKVETINTNAFKGCTSLKDVNIGSGFNQIEATAFDGCTALVSFDIRPSLPSVISIQSTSFSNTGLTEVVESVRYGSYNTFAVWKDLTKPNSTDKLDFTRK